MELYASQNAARRGYSARYIPDPEGIAPTNVILDIARDSWDSGDPFGCASELLYAIHRLWNDYQSPSMGTSPIDAWDDGSEIPLYEDFTDAIQRHGLKMADTEGMIQHAARVAQRLYDATVSAGRAY